MNEIFVLLNNTVSKGSYIVGYINKANSLEKNNLFFQHSKKHQIFSEKFVFLVSYSRTHTHTRARAQAKKYVLQLSNCYILRTDYCAVRTKVSANSFLKSDYFPVFSMYSKLLQMSASTVFKIEFTTQFYL